MSEIKKIATRDSYGRALVDIGKEDDRLVVLDADLAESTRTGWFKKEFPDRHFDCGIQEANMVGVAAGLALSGRIPFCSSFAMFAAGRAFEQIRNSVAYPKANVKIGATHAGVTVGEDGATHQCNEDMALMRAIPGMVVINPGDDVEAYAAVRAAYEYEGPVYLRFGRMAVPILNDPDTFTFEIGKGTILREGDDITLIGTGIETSAAVAAADILAGKGISAQVVSIHTVKPIDRELIASCAAKTGRVITIEEHSIIGGLGSAVAEVLCEEQPVPMKRIGVQDRFGVSGPGEKLLEFYGLDAKSIAAQAEEFINR